MQSISLPDEERMDRMRCKCVSDILVDKNSSLCSTLPSYSWGAAFPVVRKLKARSKAIPISNFILGLVFELGRSLGYIQFDWEKSVPVFIWPVSRRNLSMQMHHNIDELRCTGSRPIDSVTKASCAAHFNDVHAMFSSATRGWMGCGEELKRVQRKKQQYSNTMEICSRPFFWRNLHREVSLASRSSVKRGFTTVSRVHGVTMQCN